MVNTKLVLSTLMVPTLLLVNCGKGDSSKVASVTSLDVDNNAASLDQRFESKKETVALDTSKGGTGLNLLGILGTPVFTAILVGNVTPPKVNSTTLQAQGIYMNGTKAYISYNQAGAVGAGGLDVIDLAVPALPVIVSSVTSATSDFNSVTQSGSLIYNTGANPSLDQPAFLQTIALTAGGLLTSTATQYTLPSFAGTDAAVGSTYVYATSGDQGGVTVFNKATMTQVAYTALTDARSVKIAADGSIRVLSGQPGRISTLNATGGGLVTTNLGGAATAQSKSTLEIDATWTLASLGEAGFKVLCSATSAPEVTTAPVAVTGVSAATTVTNAVTAGSGLIFAANGEAGVQVYLAKDGTAVGGCITPALTLLGTLNLGTGLSANAVYFQNGILYVVDGAGGLKILTITVI